MSKMSKTGVGHYTLPPPSVHPHDTEHAPLKQTKNLWLSSSQVVNQGTKDYSPGEKKQLQGAVGAWQDPEHSWKDFTDNTTFHGVKYIFDDSSSRLKRILWVVCFLAAMLFFVVQVAIRISDYYKYNTNTDVQVKYTESLAFPSVTICNQNNFRMTKVVEREMYTFVDDIFATSLSNINFTSYAEYDQVNSSDFLQSTAHQITDMIDSCYWNAESCDLENDFIKVTTDMGTCYTFNHDVTNMKSTMEAGTGYGLRLIMNVEQYEAMRGPQNDAGLKILLHSPTEFPAVKDLGFSVAPGTHSLVGVHRVQVSSLPAPWGICSLNADPMSTCKVACKSRMVYEACGCLGAHMSMPDAEATVCPLTGLWGCVRNVTEHVKPTGDSCNCTVPCDRVTYKPQLSYAQLSRINIDRLVLTEASRKDKASVNFEHAMETLQRVDSVIADEDETLMGNIQEYYTSLSDATTQTLAQYGADSAIVAKLAELIVTLEEDKDTIEDLDDYFEDLVDGMSPRTVDMAITLLEYLFQMAGAEFTDISEALDEYLYCVDVMTLMLPLPDRTDPEGIVQEYQQGMNNPGWSPQTEMSAALSNDTGSGSPEEQECNSLLEFMITLSQQYYYVLQHIYDHSSGVLDLYKNVTDTIFQDSGKDAYSVSSHAECLTYINDSYVPLFLHDLQEMINIKDRIRNSGNTNDLRSAIVDMFTSLNTSQLCSYDQYLTDLKDKCYWVESWVNSEEFENVLEDGEHGFEDAAKYFTYAKTFLASVDTTLAEITEHLDGTVKVYANRTREYLSGSITKLSMVPQLTSMDTTNIFEELITEGNSIKSGFTSYLNKIDKSIDKVKEALDTLLSSEVPLITNTTLQSLQFIQALKELNSTYLTPLVNTMLTSDDYNLDPLLDYMKAFTRGAEENVEFATQGEQISLLTTQVKSLGTKLEQYQHSAKINPDFLLNNFLHVDIFYSELSYDQVEQHKAFEIISLFSEVGGFMGLLLGASILSVIEFIDFIVMAVTRRWKGNGTNGNQVTRFDGKA